MDDTTKITVPRRDDHTYVGVYFRTPEAAAKYWSITCPCGETVQYAINELPTEDTPMPCGNPSHWVVKYGVVDDG